MDSSPLSAEYIHIVRKREERCRKSSERSCASPSAFQGPRLTSVIAFIESESGTSPPRLFFFTSSFQPEQSEEGDPRPEAVRHHIVHRGYGLAVLQCKSILKCRCIHVKEDA